MTQERRAWTVGTGILHSTIRCDTKWLVEVGGFRGQEWAVFARVLKLCDGSLSFPLLASRPGDVAANLNEIVLERSDNASGARDAHCTESSRSSMVLFASEIKS